MDFKELQDLITSIGTSEDEVTRRASLTTVLNEVTDMNSKLVSATTENEKLKTDNETIRKANMDLFLQVGRGSNNVTPTTTPSTTPTSQPNDKLSFDKLFNEKGELK